MANRGVIFGGLGGSNQGQTYYVPSPIFPPSQQPWPPPLNGVVKPAPGWQRIFDAGTATRPAAFADARASAASYFDSSGTLKSVSSNAERIDYIYNGSTWVLGGLLVEDTDTDQISSSDISTWFTGSTTTALTTSILGTSPAANSYSIAQAAGFGRDQVAAPSASIHSLSTPTYWSCYVKANGYNFAGFRESGASGAMCMWDLSSGGSVVGVSGGFFSNQTITSLGGGVFKITTKFTPGSSFSQQMALVVYDTWNTGTSWGSYTADGTSGAIFAAPNITNSDPAVSSFVIPAGSATVRAADSYSFTLNSTATALIITFDDLSTQLISGLTGGATYTIPLNLNRQHILYIDDNSVAVAATNGVASSAGSNTATAVGAWIKAGVGSSAGSNTTTAVGAWLQAGTGSHVGDGADVAVGAWLQSGVGSSTGANTSTAVGAWLQSGVGSSAGTNTSSATAAPIQAKVGSATGANTSTAVGAWLQAGVGSSTGSNTSTAVGAWLQAAVGSATGANTATAVGAWLQSGVGSSTGANTSTATAAPIQAKVGSSTGANTATAIGAWLQSGVGSSSGTNTSAATGAKLQAGVGNAAGSNTSTAFVAGAPGVFSSTGTNTATAVGAWTKEAVGTAAGANTVSGIGTWLQSSVGSSAGSNVSASFSSWLQDGVGTSIGTNASYAIPSTVVVSGTGTSVGGNIADGVSYLEQSFNTDFNNDFAVYRVRVTISAVATSAGSNISHAFGTTIVVEPPVYPPPPPVVIQWHPQVEFHRVQAPRANRIFRTGTDAKRRTPLGMKRQYG